MNNNKILKEIYLKPSYGFHIRELARKTNLNPNTVSKICDDLKKEKIIFKEKKKNIVEVRADLESLEFIRKKRLFNLDLIYSSGLIDFLIKNYSPSAIVLIGSFSRGEDLERSDIDLVVLTNKKERKNLVKFENKLERNIQLLLSDLKNVSSEFINNVANGIVLHGYLRLK
jgi:predicted nucleotidyltransferase/predicted transcriptional regulator|tara:strand:- start:406 stop:918 length:513 start_codon:yes stop_codon:yes gene_type:complete